MVLVVAIAPALALPVLRCYRFVSTSSLVLVSALAVTLISILIVVRESSLVLIFALVLALEVRTHMSSSIGSGISSSNRTSTSITCSQEL